MKCDCTNKKLKVLAESVRETINNCPVCGGSGISHTETVAVPGVDPNDPNGAPIPVPEEIEIECAFCGPLTKGMMDANEILCELCMPEEEKTCLNCRERDLPGMERCWWDEGCADTANTCSRYRP